MSLVAVGPLSVPKEKLLTALLNSGALYTWWNQPANVADRLYYSMFRVPDMQAARPFGVIELTKDFSYEQFSGGDQNYLSLRGGALRLTLTDIDRYPNDIHDGDLFFENNLGLVIQDLAAIAGADDSLTISRISFEQTPTRNPPAAWQTEGMYLWCSLLIRYGDLA